MRFRTLGRTGMDVSVLGFGAATLGGEYGGVDPRAGRRAVDVAIDHGINLFDVSPYYGRTLAEERLGEALQGQRDRVVLSTKVGRYDREHPAGFDFSADRVARSVEESLRRLRTDCVDVLLAHDVEFASPEVIVNETLPAMRRLRTEGKVRWVGVSGYPPEVLRRVGAAGDVDVILSYCHYNLLNTRMHEVLAPLAEARRIGLINASPLHMGLLTRHAPPAWHPAPAAMVDAGRRAAAACAVRGRDIADLALRFALTTSAASTLVGMCSEAEVRANLRALEPTEDDPQLLAEVERILAPVKDMEWPSGIEAGDLRSDAVA